MIIKEYKALFVHVPKTAGQSIEDFFLSSLGHNRKEHGASYLLRPKTKFEEGPKRLAHLTINQYVDYSYITEKAFGTYFTFAIVRNPWDRIISFYKYRGFANLVSFEKFVISYLPLYIKNEHWFFRPQADFIFNEQNELRIDYMGRFEKLEFALSVIASKINIDFKELPRSNSSKTESILSSKSVHLLRKHPEVLFQINRKDSKNKISYRDYYSKKSKAIIDNIYKRDIDLLEYTF
ncbi:sulfotransferase family 2 domain-containing protein [Cochleicola gelatinilyticus]|uniref:Sulfotransferase family protein n=1 Tax=Cochleicola gelatinilyticus TaxID=1763537 RepID=A0A167G8P5_9FLAO|nr:sulfotransferase family 2 domain-containing protein [Cochleicola gelatinilyticus]OAB77335.1 hypothetical protein ULVI_12595 [Cochleicola gelatinilyticus]